MFSRGGVAGREEGFFVGWGGGGESVTSCKILLFSFLVLSFFHDLIAVPTLGELLTLLSLALNV